MSPYRDAVAELGGRPAPRPFWRRFTFWLMLLVICVSLTGLGFSTAADSRARSADRHTLAVAKQQAALAKAQAVEAQARENELRKAFCGLLVPIGKEPISAATSGLGHTLISGARTGGIVIQCPGAHR